MSKLKLKVGEGLLNEASKQLAQKEAYDIQYLRFDQIILNKNNKYHVSEEEVLELADAIRKMGLVQNLDVRDIGNDQYRLLTGEKRYRALTYLHERGEWKEFVPVTVRDVEKIDLPINDELKEKYAIIMTNKTQRDYTDEDWLNELNDMEEIYAALREAGVEEYEGQRIKGVKTRDLLMQKMHLSSGQITKLQKINKSGSELVKEAISAGMVNINVGNEIAALPKEDQNAIIEEKLEEILPEVEESKEVEESEEVEKTKEVENVDPIRAMLLDNNVGKITIEDVANYKEKKEVQENKIVRVNKDDIENIINLMKKGIEQGLELPESKYKKFEKALESLKKYFI